MARKKFIHPKQRRTYRLTEFHLSDFEDRSLFLKFDGLSLKDMTERQIVLILDEKNLLALTQSLSRFPELRKIFKSISGNSKKELKGGVLARA